MNIDQFKGEKRRKKLFDYILHGLVVRICFLRTNDGWRGDCTLVYILTL